eukprot:512953-Rhodomonas_salina.3
MVSKGSVLTSGMVLPGLVRQLADIAMRPKHAPPVVATEEIPGARVSTRRFLARAVLCCAMPGVWRLLLTARGVLHQSTRRWSAPGCGFAWWRPSRAADDVESAEDARRSCAFAIASVAANRDSASHIIKPITKIRPVLPALVWVLSSPFTDPEHLQPEEASLAAAVADGALREEDSALGNASGVGGAKEGR